MKNNKTEPAKKAAPEKKTTEPVKKAPVKAPASAEVPAKKAVAPKETAVVKTEPAKPAVAKKATAKGAKPTPVRTMPSKPLLPGPLATPATPVRNVLREEKKPAIIVAHRRLPSKAKNSTDEGKTMINYQPDFNRSILDEPEHQQGPVYRYSDEELGEFRDLINSRLESARKELVYLQGLITRKDEAGTEDTENRYMNMEDGSGAMEREQLAQLASRQIQFTNHLEKALIRIENKTYGICRVTGKLIDKARLRAVPHATLSIEAKNYMANK